MSDRTKGDTSFVIPSLDLAFISVYRPAAEEGFDRGHTISQKWNNTVLRVNLRLALLENIWQALS